ncbi:Ras GTPase, variant 2 [Balamuthia mandrillaris]
MVIENERCILRINDTPGLHAGENWTKESLVPMQGFLLVYSVTSKESFDKITELRDKIASCKTETKVPFVLVGNKCEDVLNRQITTSLGFQLAKMLDIPFFETSAKEKDVQECFSVLVKKVKSIFQSVPTVELGEMHKSGILEKQRGKKWHKRLFVLREGSLTYHHVEGTKSMAQRGGLCFDSSTRLEIGDFDPKVGFIFSITFSGEKYTLAAATAEERASWMGTARLNIAIAEVGESLVEETIRPVLAQLLSSVPPSNDKPRKSRSLSSMRRGEELTPSSPHHDGENTSPAFSPKQTGRWTSAGAPASEGDSSFHCNNNNNSEGERKGGECTEASEAGEETPSRASVYGGLAASPTGGGGSSFNRHTTPPSKTAAAAGGRPTPPPRPSFMKELAEAQSRKLKHKHNSVGVPADLSPHSHTQHFITANNNYATATTVELHHSSPSVSPVGGTGGSVPRRKSGGLLRKKHSIARWFEAEDSPSSSPLSSSSSSTSAGGEGHLHPAASTDTFGSPPPAGISGSGAGFALRPSSLTDELGQGAKKQAKKQAKLLRKEFKKKEKQEKLKRAHSQRTLTDSFSQT